MKNINLLNNNNNDLLNTSLKIANEFNDYFNAIGSAIDKKIFNTNACYKDYSNEKDKYGNLIINCNKSLYLTPTTPDEIAKIINYLTENKSSGPNRRPLFI